MCIARVGKVLVAREGKAKVEFFDGKGLGDVDISMLKGAGKGAFVEVYGNLALSVLGASEARKRREAWREIRKAAALPSDGVDLV